MVIIVSAPVQTKDNLSISMHLKITILKPTFIINSQSYSYMLQQCSICYCKIMVGSFDYFCELGL